jgi:hypothetical protein
MADSSGRSVKLHPLVLINISDHYTRLTAEQPLSRLSAEQQHAMEVEKGLPTGSLASASGAHDPEKTTVAGASSMIGALYGKQEGLEVHILNSYEIVAEAKPDGSFVTDSDHVKKSVELSKCTLKERVRFQSTIKPLLFSTISGRRISYI